MGRVSNGGSNNDIVIPSGTWIGNQSAFSLLFWFKSPSNAGGNNNACFFDGAQSFPASLDVQLHTDGSIIYFYRDDASSNFTITSSTGWDDSKWHIAFIVKRSATDHQFYLDWTSQGTSATSIGTMTPVAQSFGSAGANNLPNGGIMARAMLWRRALTIPEATTAAYYGMARSGGALGVGWFELGYPTTEPDFSGHQNNSSSIGANSTIGANGPYAPAFGFDLGWNGPFVPPPPPPHVKFLNAGTRPRPFAPGLAR